VQAVILSAAKDLVLKFFVALGMTGLMTRFFSCIHSNDKTRFILFVAFLWRSKASAQGIFYYYARNGELEQVIRPAGLGTDPGQLETAKGMPFHDGPGAAAVDIQVAHPEFPPGPVDIFGAAGENAAGKGKPGPVGYL